MIKKALVYTVVALGSAITPAIAGGGLISITSTPTGPIPAGQAYTLTAAVQTEDYKPCRNCPIEWFVEDLHPTKYVINPESNKTDDNGNAVAKIALTANGDATMSVYTKAILPTQSYRSSNVLLYFKQTDHVNDYFPVESIAPAPYIGGDTSSPAPSVYPTSNPALDQLQNKVDDLQNKLSETQKKQGFLESQINAIMSFLKNIFHFGK